MTTLQRRLAMLLLPPALLMGACTTATGDDAMAAFELQGDGPYQRFIVRYRDDSAPARDKDGVPARLARTAGEAKLTPTPVLDWQRRLAVGGDVFRSERPLDRAEATALMHAFARDPDVEYVEIDRMMGTGPLPQAPMQRRDAD